MATEITKKPHPKKKRTSADSAILPLPVPKPGPILIPPPPGLYSFSLSSFQIVNQRSLIHDTDYVGISLTILQGGDPHRMFQPTVQSKSMGSIGKGHYSVNLSFVDVEISDKDVAVFSYSITNSATPDTKAIGSALESSMKKLTAAAINAGFSAIGIPIGSIPIIGSALTSGVAGWLVSEFDGLFPGGCDGLVALAVHSFSSSELNALVADGPYSNVENNPGTNSSDGCGANSNYNVTWGISRP